MTRTSRVLQFLLVVALLGWASSPTFAQTGCPLITVDENGNGTIDLSGCGFGGVTPVAGVLAPDPGPGGLASVLTYFSPFSPPSLVAGDVGLTDADLGGATLDYIRFNPAGTGSQTSFSLVFYSDNVDGVDSLGDTPSPPGAFYSNLVTIPEVGPEGNNRAIYTPTDGQPGFVSGFTATYDFISDSTGAPPVPEPGTLWLLGTGRADGLGWPDSAQA